MISKVRFYLVILLTLCFATAGSAHAQSPTFAGRIFSVQGSAVVKRGQDSIPVTEGLELQEGDELITGEPGRVAIELPDGSYVRVASGSNNASLTVLSCVTTNEDAALIEPTVMGDSS